MRGVTIEFLLFIVAGGIAAIVNFSSRILLSAYFNYLFSIIIAYLIGMIVAFVLNRSFVFKTDNQIYKQIKWFVLVNIAGIIQTTLISLYLAHSLFPAIQLTWHPKEIAHLIGLAVPTFTSYLGHKYITFHVKSEHNRSERNI